MRRASLLGAILMTAFFPSACLASVLPESLRCEYLVDPSAVDAARPRLSWALASDGRGAGQTAYQVLVASSADLLDSDRGDLWDSGKVGSDRTATNTTATLQFGRSVLVEGVWDTADASSPWSAVAMAEGFGRTRWTRIEGRARLPIANPHRCFGVVASARPSARPRTSAHGVYEL